MKTIDELQIEAEVAAQERVDTAVDQLERATKDLARAVDMQKMILANWADMRAKGQ